MLNEEDQIKMACIFSKEILYCWILLQISLFYNRVKFSLNIYTGICLVVMSGCYLIYGIVYAELMIIFVNFFGMGIGIVYLSIYNCIRKQFTGFKEITGETVVDIEIKNDN